jgi:hypothetical protein
MIPQLLILHALNARGTYHAGPAPGAARASSRPYYTGYELVFDASVA